MNSQLEMIFHFYTSINNWTEDNHNLFSRSLPKMQEADKLYQQLQLVYHEHFSEPWTEEQLFKKEVRECERCKPLIKQYHRVINSIQAEFHRVNYRLRQVCDIVQNFIEQYESSLTVLANMNIKDKQSSMYKYLTQNKPNVQALYHIQTFCNILTFEPYKTYIPRIPRSLVDILSHQPLSYIRHKDSLQLLLNSQVEFKDEGIICSTSSYSMQEYDRLVDTKRQQNMKCLQMYIRDQLEKYNKQYFNSSWKLPFYSHLIQESFSDAKRISDNTSGGIIYQASLNKTIPIILKCGKDDDFDNNNLLHEFIIGSFLNQLRSQTPSFCYTYFGFLCTSFVMGFDHMCKIIPINMFHPNEEKDEANDFVLTTIIGMEECKGLSLQQFVQAHYNNTMILAQVFMQLLFALQIAYQEFKFVHGDLHATNVIVIQLDVPKLIDIGSYTIQTNFIPQIIDFGMSILDAGMGVLTPFAQMFTRYLQPSHIEYQVCKEGKNEFTSYDFLRCLTSLKVPSYGFIQECFPLLYQLEVNHDCKIKRWLQHPSSLKTQISYEDEPYLKLNLQTLIDSCYQLIR